jgi:hypothetical protein
MSAGSKRISMRLGKKLNELVMEEVDRRNKQTGGVTEWNVTDWMIAAIIDKINHSHRSRKTGRKVTMEIKDDGKRSIEVYGPAWTDKDATAGKTERGEFHELPLPTSHADDIL